MNESLWWYTQLQNGSKTEDVPSGGGSDKKGNVFALLHQRIDVCIEL